MAKRRYTDEQRASLVAMLTSEGYTGNIKTNRRGALKKVATYSGVNERVLRYWFKGEINPPPANIVRQKKRSLSDKYKQIADEYTDILLDKERQAEASVRDASVVAGTAVDKYRLLEGLPTEIIGVIPGVVQALQDAGHDPVKILTDLQERAQLIANERQH